MGLTPPARLAVVALIMVAGALSAQDRTEEPPVAGRPAYFSHLVGRYHIAATADRTEVFVEEPITLTVRITGMGPRTYQPVRKHLNLFVEEVTDQFYIEPVPDQDRTVLADGVWEFVYRLRPKFAQVKYIAGPRLSYYLPERRAYQTTYADDINITVKPKPEKTPQEVGLSIAQPPDRLYRLITGPAVLARQEVRAYWSPAVLLIVLLGPPLLSGVGLLVYRRLRPDGSRANWQRRSRVARHALHKLAHVKGDDAPGRQVAILTDYLRERLDFPAAEPTPAEVAHFLKRLGVAAPVRRQWGEFLRVCDEERFGAVPLSPEEASRNEQAMNLVHAMENDPCISARIAN